MNKPFKVGDEVMVVTSAGSLLSRSRVVKARQFKYTTHVILEDGSKWTDQGRPTGPGAEHKTQRLMIYDQGWLDAREAESQHRTAAYKLGKVPFFDLPADVVQGALTLVTEAGWMWNPETQRWVKP